MPASLLKNAAWRSQSQAEIGNISAKAEDKIRDYEQLSRRLKKEINWIVKMQPTFYQTYKNQAGDDSQAKSQIIGGYTNCLARV